MTMSWLDRAEARLHSREGRERVRKAFSMPMFWSDGDRVALNMAASYGISPEKEMVGSGFESYIAGVFRESGPVFGTIAVRARVFSQARMAYERLRDGRHAGYFTNDSLRILESPWSGGSTAALLRDMEFDASLAGNHMAVMVDQSGRIGASARREDGAYVARMRPDWCTLLVRAPSGNPFNVDARVVGLSYSPPGMREDPLLLTRKEFSHYAPIPDPEARFRGMSWLTPIIRDAQADMAYTKHKTAFLKNGATPNLVVKMGEDVEEDELRRFVQQFKEEYEGASNAYKTLFVAGGADVTPLSVDFQQISVREGQMSLETRIAQAGGVHPIIAGFSEGLGGSSLNEGNFHAARRLFVDSTVRDLWNAAGPALSVFAPPPGGDTRLVADPRDIPFLRDDAKDEAETFFVQAQAARQLLDGGWEPDAIVAALKAADISLLLGKHTGMVSVQLQKPGAGQEEETQGTGEAGQDGGTMPTLDGPTNGRRPALTAR